MQKEKLSPLFIIQEDNNKILIKIRLSPGASKNAITGIYSNALKITVTSPPEDNKANKHLIKFLAKTLRLSKSNITIISGHKSRDKTLSIQGISIQAIRDKISGFL